MKWPLVHRARLEAAEQVSLMWHAQYECEQVKAARLFDELLRMKQQGFTAVPPRTTPTPGVPYRGTEVLSREKLVTQFMDETGDKKQAELAADQLLQELL